MLGAAGPVTEDMEEKVQTEVMETFDVTGPAISAELDPQVVEATRKVQETMYPVCSSHNVNFLEAF